MIGRVTSNKAKNTATVLVQRTKRHPLYRKDYVSTKKYLVDDQIQVKVGDIVEFNKCRPISKRKHWRITKIVGQDFVALGEEQLKETAAEAIAEVLPEETKEESASAQDMEMKESGANVKAAKPKKAKKGKSE